MGFLHEYILLFMKKKLEKLVLGKVSSYEFRKRNESTYENDLSYTFL